MELQKVEKIQDPVNVLKSLQSQSGLFLAAPAENTGYDKA